jgi:Acyclic terpene utilisation family protein AtuA
VADATPASLRVGNCSGFYGDRLSAMREMLEGGPLDVLTGDYLAELTMLILGKDTLKDSSLGFARTFVRQLEDALALAVEKRVRIVSNAGGLNPAGLAERVREVARGLGLEVSVAHVEGDDVRAHAAELGLDGALTANAYLGGFGIAAALRGGADVVVAGRVTDASLVVGPAAAHFGWEPTAYDALAGATVAGHVLECGAHATGGNFSGFLDLPRDGRPLGFPLAEIAADGSYVVTKHPGTGGAVTVDTVTAQLFYEIQAHRYLGPDVTTRLDTIHLEQQGEDRVAVAGVRGEPPPERLKVGANVLGGYRNSVELVLTGLDVDAKADWVTAQVEAAWGARSPAEVTWTRTRAPEPDADTEEAASCLLRCVVKDPSAEVAGKGLTGPVVELALASYPGFTMTGPPTPASPYGVFRTAYADRSVVEHTVVHADGRREVVPDPPPARTRLSPAGVATGLFIGGATRRAPLGLFVHARSGDKGGDANLGLWVRHDGDDRRDGRVGWLLATVTQEWVRRLIPEAEDLDLEIHPLPELGGVNVVLHGLLGEGVAASTRFDPQAKALGEWARSRLVEIPEELL